MARFKSSNRPLRTFKAKQRIIPKGVHSLVIDNMTDDGRGVSRVDGKTVFVQGALVGELVKAEYKASFKNHDEAVTLEVVDPSALRVKAPCDYASRCGGCSLQHLGYDAQVEHKQKQLHALFEPLISLASNSDVVPITASPLHYRHRARLAVDASRQGCELGFRQVNSHRIVDIDDCKIIYQSLSDRLPSLKMLLSTLRSRSNITELSITEDSFGKQGVMLQCKFVVADDDLKLLEEYSLAHTVPISLYLTSSEDEAPYWTVGNQLFNYCLSDSSIELPFSPTDFTQVNPAINKQLIACAVSWLKLNTNDHLADYFCGIGNFSLSLANYVASVTGYELVKSMVEKAKNNALVNSIDNAQFFVGDLMASSARLNSGPNKVLLDPPRAGADLLCKELAKSNIERIVYISCNPKTLFRDAQHLASGNFILEKLKLADMFPQTRHSEAIALFTRR